MYSTAWHLQDTVCLEQCVKACWPYRDNKWPTISKLQNLHCTSLLLDSKMYRNLDFYLRRRMRKLDLLGISWKNRTDLCIVLKASLTFFSTSSELIAFNGSFIQLSCHRNQSETVIHKFRNGSNSFTSLDSFSYYNDKCRAATITSITHCAFCKRCHNNQAKLSYNTKGIVL